MSGNHTPSTRQYSHHSRSGSSHCGTPLDTHSVLHRKISNTSIHSEPPPRGEELGLGIPPANGCPSVLNPHHFSLPNLTIDDSQCTPYLIGPPNPTSDVAGGVSALPGPVAELVPATSATPDNYYNIICPSLLQERDLSKLESSLEDSYADFLRYQTNSPVPSSTSIASLAISTFSAYDVFEESPSVQALCEMLSESPNVQQADFANMTFTGTDRLTQHWLGRNSHQACVLHSFRADCIHAHMHTHSHSYSQTHTLSHTL